MSKLDFRSYYVPYHLKELNSIKEEENESHEEDRLKMDMLKRGKEAKNQLKKKKKVELLHLLHTSYLR
jgi:peroxiredoxin family protein